MIPERVPANRFKPILERAIAERNEENPYGAFNNGLGGVDRVSMEIAKVSGKQKRTVDRYIHKIISGWCAYTPEPVKWAKSRPATKGQKRILAEAGIEHRDDMNAYDANALLFEKVKRRPYAHISFSFADEILVGLNLVHLWHTDLSDIYCQGMENEDEFGMELTT